MSVLLDLYFARPDLRQTYPEVERGEYGGLLRWASSYGVVEASSAEILARHLSWYRDPTLHEAKLAIRDDNVRRLESELSVIKSSFGYKLMKFYASGIDRLFPEGTSRGELRKGAKPTL
jgi:hypothetical protein